MSSESSSLNSADVAILGAGLTGLSAGKKLATSTANRVVILEKESVVGGLAASITIDGFIFDYSGHRFWTKDREILSYVKDLVGPDLILVPRKSSIVVNDRFLNYPPDILEFLRKMPPIISAKCLWSYFVGAAKNLVVKQGHDDTMLEWGNRNFGKGFFRYYISDYTTKSWGTEPQNISSLWAKQRIKVPDIVSTIGKAILGRPANHTRGYNTEFYYPRRGIGSIAQSMKTDLDNYPDTEIILGTTIHSIEVSDQRIVAIEYEKDGQIFALEPGFTISTIPLDKLVSYFQPANERLLELARGLRYRSLVFAFLLIAKRSITDDSWVYIPDPNIIFTRFYEPKNWSPVCARPGMTSLCVEIHCDIEDEVWTMPSNEILEEVISGLNELNLVSPDQVIKGEIRRVLNAYPINVRPEYDQIAKSLIDEVDKIQNLICAGRQGVYSYINMDHAIMMGFRAAQVVNEKATKVSVRKIARSESYFETPDEIVK